MFAEIVGALINIDEGQKLDRLSSAANCPRLWAKSSPPLEVEEKMLDDLMKSAKESIVDRLSNPFLFSFAASWCGWNYKFIMILLSEDSILTTVWLVETVAFPLPWSHPLLRGFLYPLATSALFLLLYPHPTRIAYAYLRRQMVRQNQERQQIDKETLLTREEMDARQAVMDRELREKDGQIRQAEQEVRQARERESRLTQLLENARNENEPSVRSRADAERLRAEANEMVAANQERVTVLTDSNKQLLRLLQSIVEGEEWSLAKVVEFLTPEQRNVLRILEQSGGSAETSALRNESKLSVAAFRAAVQHLEWFSLVADQPKQHSSGTDRVRLLDLGRRVLKEIEAPDATGASHAAGAQSTEGAETNAAPKA